MLLNPVRDLDKIQIQTISTCNAKCTICPYANSWMISNPGKMDRKLFSKILMDLEEFKNLKTICLYLMNDPLTDTRIFDLIKETSDHYPNIEIEISTNPLNLHSSNRRKALQTLHNKKHCLWISFHGINEGTMKFLMGIPFKICMKNVLDLLEEDKDQSLNIKIRGTGMSLNNKFFIFSPEQYRGMWQYYLNERGLKSSRYDIEYFPFHDRAGNLLHERSFLNFNFRRKIDPDHPFYCVRFDKVFHVLWDGTIITCCMDYRQEWDLGNIRDQSIVDYYSSRKYLDFIEVASGKKEAPKDFICARCCSPGG